jgi:hypothetical protein
MDEIDRSMSQVNQCGSPLSARIGFMYVLSWLCYHSACKAASVVPRQQRSRASQRVSDVARDNCILLVSLHAMFDDVPCCLACGSYAAYVVARLYGTFSGACPSPDT